MVTTPLLVYISTGAVLPPLVAALVQWKRLNVLERKIGWLLIVNTLVQGLALLLGDVFQVNNMPLYHVYLVVEFNLLFGIYFYGVFNNQEQNRWKTMAAVSFLVLLGNGLFIEPWTTFPSYLRTLEALLATTLAIKYFITKLRGVDAKPLANDPAFWLSTGVLLYYTTNLLLFMYGKVLPHQPDVFRHTWLIHGYLNILLYSLYTFAMLCRKKT